VKRLLGAIDSQATGALVMDAHLAALANKYGVTFCTDDADFTRFARLRTHDPLLT
jgi:predicted nucleic acid-binding protein